ncbi:MarR family transcriptional regulator [Longispora albida]|uniref:MarR family transcriptional regulator n=1 Tax=Longispora albida TaxID=203523 RepID=UPI00037613FE|nr:helix-turn-helix domain-containing protein [Longispora albida]
MTEGANSREEALDSSQWRPLRLLMEAMDDDIAGLYEDAGITGLRPRFAGPLIALARHEVMSVQELATRAEVTHSAMSQTVAAMRKSELVEDAGPGDGSGGRDGRTRQVRLSQRGHELVSFVEAEWLATEASLRELEAELPYGVGQVVADVRAAFAARPFKDRLKANLERALRGEL